MIVAVNFGNPSSGVLNEPMNGQHVDKKNLTVGNLVSWAR